LSLTIETPPLPSSGYNRLWQLFACILHIAKKPKINSGLPRAWLSITYYACLHTRLFHIFQPSNS